MTYYKLINDGCVIAVGDGAVGTSITEAEYNQLLTIIRNAPTVPEGYTHRLRADTLEWELVELPPVPEPEDEPTAEDKAEAYDILMGVSE